MQSCPLCTSQDLVTNEHKNHFNQLANKISILRYYECLECRLISLDPAHHLSSAEERARYELHQNSPHDLEYREFLNRLLVPLLAGLRPGMRGLDYGCGPAPTISVMLHEQGYQVENYDPFFFPRHFKSTEQFDFIICTEVIEHFYTPAQEFEQISTLLKKDGIFALMTQVLEEKLDFEDWWYRRDPTHVSFYQPSTFEWLARSFNWKIIETRANVRFFLKNNEVR